MGEFFCDFAQTSDIAVRLGDAEDLSTPAARRALPHCLYAGDFAGGVCGLYLDRDQLGLAVSIR